MNARKLARKYNSTDEDDQEEQAQILRKLLPATEELPYLQRLFILITDVIRSLEDSALLILTYMFRIDMCKLHIGDNVMIGPNVTLAISYASIITSK